MDATAVAATALAPKTVCEIGPTVIRRLCGGAEEPVQNADMAFVRAALDCGVEPLVLIGDRPIPHDAVWLAVLEPLLRATEPALLVHPTWWTASRIESVSAVAHPLAGGITTGTRPWLLGAVAGDAPVVEIGPQVVVVTVPGGGPPGIQIRTVPPADIADSIVRMLLRGTDEVTVWLDAPVGVPGAAALAALIGDRLRAAGRAVHRVGDRDLLTAAARVGLPNREPVEPAGQLRRPRRRLLAASVVAVMTGAVAVGVWGVDRPDVSPTAPAEAPAKALVEGRVTMQIPANWAVRRISAGPGSARVEVLSPTNGETALHLTQTSVRDDSLTAAAAMLRRAIDAEPAGVFVDFHPSDQRGGRPAVTYREIRPGHDIRWAVVLDGGLRIGIGCQSGTGSEPEVTTDVKAACDQAVRSAHEIG